MYKQDMYTIDRIEEQEEITSFCRHSAQDAIEQVLYSSNGDGALPELRLIIGIMQSAADLNDMLYFTGHAFKYHCFLLGLDADTMLEMIVRKKLLAKEVTKRYTYQTILEEEDNIINQHELEGIPIDVLATMYNVGSGTIRKILNGTYAPVIAFNGQQFSIVKDYLAGKTKEQLMEDYNMAESTIYRALQGVDKTGIKGRPSKVLDKGV